jgi:hypothetical protein
VFESHRAHFYQFCSSFQTECRLLKVTINSFRDRDMLDFLRSLSSECKSEPSSNILTAPSQSADKPDAIFLIMKSCALLPGPKNAKRRLYIRPRICQKEIEIGYGARLKIKPSTFSRAVTSSSSPFR